MDIYSSTFQNLYLIFFTQKYRIYLML